MPSEASELLFTPSTLLWLVVSLTAAAILFGSINRRRSRLTDSLREYVDRHQAASEANGSGPGARTETDRQPEEGSRD